MSNVLNNIRVWSGKAGKAVMNNPDRICRILILLLGFLYLMIASLSNLRYHEIDSYALPSVSIQHRGSLTMCEEDLKQAQIDFPDLYEGINTFDDLRSAKLIKSDENVWLSYYFPLYGAICVPVKIVFQLAGLPQKYCFSVTNALLVIIAFMVIYKKLKVNGWQKIAFIIALALSPIREYIPYIGAEVLMYSFMTISLVFYYNKSYRAAAVFISLASFCNNCVLGLGIIMILNYCTEVVLRRLTEKDATTKEKLWNIFIDLVKLAVCYLIVFIPFVFNKIYLSTGNIYIKGADFGGMFNRTYHYLVDLNFGFASFVPAFLILAAVVLVISIIKKKFHFVWLSGAFLFTICAFSLMIHINCGMFYCARYVLWTYPILAFICSVGFCEAVGNVAVKLPVFTVCSAVTIAIMTVNSTGSVNHCDLNNFSKLVLDKAPALYDPLPSTFNSRVYHIDGGYNPLSPVIYYDSENGEMRKMLIYGNDESKQEIIDTFGYISGNSSFEEVINAVPSDDNWHYLNFLSWETEKPVWTYKQYPVEMLNITGTAEKDGGSIKLPKDSLQFGPFVDLSEGKYRITIHGSELSTTYSDIFSGENVPFTEISRTDEEVIISVETDKRLERVEIRTSNGSDIVAHITSIEIRRYNEGDETEAGLISTGAASDRIRCYGGESRIYGLIRDSGFTPAMTEENKAGYTDYISRLTYSADHLYLLGDGEYTDDGRLELCRGSVQFGPYSELGEGVYMVTINGDGLLSGYSDIFVSGALAPYTEISRTDSSAVLVFQLSQRTENLEFRNINLYSDDDIAISDIVLTPFESMEAAVSSTAELAVQSGKVTDCGELETRYMSALAEDRGFYMNEYDRDSLTRSYIMSQEYMPSSLAVTIGTGMDDNGGLIIQPGAIQYGPFAHLFPGSYQVTFCGEGFELAEFDIFSGSDPEIEQERISVDDNQAVYVFSLDQELSDIEFRTFNNESEESITLTSILIEAA